jgi:hypothetical protein
VDDTLPLSSYPQQQQQQAAGGAWTPSASTPLPRGSGAGGGEAAEALLSRCLVNPIVLVAADCRCGTRQDDGRGWYKGRAGTSAYWCPQMLGRDAVGERMAYGMEADWWSLGCLTFALMTGRSPFATGMGTQFDNAQTLEGAAKIHWPKGVFSREARDFITRLCCVDASRRLGAGPEGWRQVMSHPWFRGVDFALLEARVLPPPSLPSYRISTSWTAIPDKIDNQHRGAAAEEAAAAEAAARATAAGAVLTAEDEAIFRACTYTSPYLFRRAYLRSTASRSVDQLLAIRVLPCALQGLRATAAAPAEAAPAPRQATLPPQSGRASSAAGGGLLSIAARRRSSSEVLSMATDAPDGIVAGSSRRGSVGSLGGPGTRP